MMAEQTIVRSVVLIAVLALVVGCATTPGNSVQETMMVPKAAVGADAEGTPEAAEMKEAAPADAAAPAVDERFDFPEYLIGAGDILRFRSYDDPTLDTEVTVRHDGYIALAWVPDVEVMGKTREEATELLVEAYSEIYFNPELSLTVVAARSRFFTVMGDVQRPAQYPYDRPMTLLDGINLAGGLRINQQGGDSFMGAQGQLVKAILIREADEGIRKAKEYDLRNLEKGGEHAAFTPLLPGDLIYVPEGINLVYLLGEGVQSRAISLREGTTLLQFLANSGGFSESITRMRRVVVMRETSEDEMKLVLCDLKSMLAGGSQFVLMPGDVIYLPKKRLVNLSEFIGRVSSPILQTSNLASSVMSLYGQVYDTYYTEERYDNLFGSQGRSTDTLSLLQSIRDLNEFGAVLGTTLATE